MPREYSLGCLVDGCYLWIIVTLGIQDARISKNGALMQKIKYVWKCMGFFFLKKGQEKNGSDFWDPFLFLYQCLTWKLNWRKTACLPTSNLKKLISFSEILQHSYANLTGYKLCRLNLTVMPDLKKDFSKIYVDFFLGGGVQWRGSLIRGMNCGYATILRSIIAMYYFISILSV